MTRVAIRAAGATHTGKVREANEDTLLCEPELGLHAVFDGMGGHMAGDVAAARARDVLREAVAAGRDAGAAAQLLVDAIAAASRAIFTDAQGRHDRRGMGTTVVACLVIGGNRVAIAHVGDSRAYLLREGRLQQLTRDHTVLAELLASGVVRPEEAARHPYQNVLSRNLGAKPDVQVDLQELALAPGDRLLLCSDGLNGFASLEAIEQVLGGAEDADHAAADLVELALRGGGGDNVTAVVVTVGAAVLEATTHIVRTSGAAEWWRRRDRFLQMVQARGLARSPICAVLREAEAIEIVGGNLHEAVYHDLEQTTGIHVWTYAENLAAGWLDQDGSWEALRDLLDLLRGAAGAVVAEMASEGAPFAAALDVAVVRTLVVAEQAVGELLADRLRDVEAALADVRERLARPRTFVDQPTVQVVTAPSDPPPPEVIALLAGAHTAALEQAGKAGAAAPVTGFLEWAHRCAMHPEATSDAAMIAHELLGTAVGERSVAPLLDLLDVARRLHADALHRADVAVDVRAAAARRAVEAHRVLAFAVARAVIEGGLPVTDALRRAASQADALRLMVASEEARLAEVESWRPGRAEAPP